MINCCIAGLNVQIKEPIYERTLSQIKKYRVTDKDFKADIRYTITQEQIESYIEESHRRGENVDWPLQVQYEEVEYMMTGAYFYESIIPFQAMLLHSSAVVLDNKAYLFSGSSGAGKSTHTSLWLKEFTEAYIINEDKPAVRMINGHFYACGTPWSGKTNININEMVEIGGIVFVSQSKDNWIRDMKEHQKFEHIFAQTIRKLDKAKMEGLFELIDNIITSVPIYEMGCDISSEAVQMTYSKLTENR